ncbi:Uncharacterized protein BM_BM12983 [Brugia malayi]|uniref:Bm12983 n=1 Tax=Brugia malayi TaxID=6279 RepID=A0A4E9FH11_BRUMA|nr:Uncharacterized protein BM_BM12983 [Brugia malayi]VIO95782.1 Uncharacterized protein BM_BM12983 [Brugia malayi]
MLPKLLILFGLISIIDRIDNQHGKFIVQGKNDSQKSEENDEKYVKSLIQKLPAMLAFGENQAVDRQTNPENATRVELYDPSNLRNIFKAVSLLAYLHSMSLANRSQANTRQNDEGYNKEDGLIHIRNEIAKFQKKNNIMNDQLNSSKKQHLNAENISEINNFTLELKKLIEETSDAVRRNPRYSHLIDPLSLTYAQNEFEDGMNSNLRDEIKKELKTNETMNIGNSSEFDNNSDFRTAQKSMIKSRQGREAEVIRKKTVVKTTLNTTMDGANIKGQLTGNFSNETMSIINYFANGTYFRKIIKKKKKIIQEKQPVITEKKVTAMNKQPDSLSTSAKDNNLATSTSDEQITENTVDETTSGGNHSEFSNGSPQDEGYRVTQPKGIDSDQSDSDVVPERKDAIDKKSDLKIQESHIEADYSDNDDVVDDDSADRNDIREVSILSNGQKEKIIYASKPVEQEEESEISESDPQKNVIKADFKKVKSSAEVNESGYAYDEDNPVEFKKIIIDITPSTKAVGILSRFHPILIFLLLKGLLALF